MERIKKLWYRFRLPLTGLAVVLTVGAGLVSHRLQGQPLVLDAESSASPIPEASPSPDLVVDIQGAVAKPGVRELPAGSLLVDAIKAAGGFTQDADRGHVAHEMNQAAALKDHQKIYIPLLGEVIPKSVSGSGESGDGDGLVNLNTADATELDTLPGVGEATAASIIDYREAFGPFESVEELLEVSGIGEAKLEKLRDLVTV